MNDDVFADVKAAAGNIDPEYLQERWRRANSDAVRSPDGATLALKDSTGISLTGPAHEVGRAYGAIIAATCPDAFRGKPEPAPTTNWDATAPPPAPVKMQRPEASLRPHVKNWRHYEERGTGTRD